MNQDRHPTSLDDEALKLAVRSAWGDGGASSDLRQRIHLAMTRAVLEDPSIPQNTRSRRFWDAWPSSWRLAAGIAALLLISAGVSYGILDYQSRPRFTRQVPDFTAPPAKPSLFAMLVARHDDFAAGLEADDSIPVAIKLDALRNELAARFNHPIWAPDLAKLGWKLVSVRIYPISGTNAAAFHYTRGEASLTAFSLPISDDAGLCNTSQTELDQLVDNRSLSAFSTGGQLFALVGSQGASPFPAAELHSLVSQFRNDPSCQSTCR